MLPKKFYESRQSAMELKDIKNLNENSSDTSQSTDSSFSHNRLSRQQEKQHLASLNDRLASYIERVRHLETENARLHVRISDEEVVERREKENKTAHYENKLSEIRNQLDAVSLEKAKVELEHTKAMNQLNSLKTEIAKLQSELNSAKKRAEDASHDIHDLKHRLDLKERDLHGMENEIAESKKKLDGYKFSIGSLRSQLEKEILLKSELERKIAAFKDELEFVRKNQNIQIEEYRRKRQSEMNVFSSEVENRYQVKLQEQLQSMRADLDARIAQSRAELDEKYKNKLAEAAESATRNRTIATEARKDAARYRSSVQELEAKIASHNSTINGLKERISELENHLKNVRESMEIQMQQRDERISSLESEISSMMNDFQDLMDVKVQLDSELQAYQKLLEGEEQRLRISPIVNHTSSHQSTFFNDSFKDAKQFSSNPATKRRRVENWTTYHHEKMTDVCKAIIHAEGEVVIEDVGVNSEYIRLLNRSDSAINICDWIIKCTAGNKEVMFKFGSRQIIQEERTVTIWSCNAEGKLHIYPQHISMKNQIWPVSDVIITELLNAEGLPVAWHKCFIKRN